MKNKIFRDIIGYIPEITRRVRVGKFFIFSINERVFSMLQKYIGHEFHQMDGYGTVCEPSLNH